MKKLRLIAIVPCLLIVWGCTFQEPTKSTEMTAQQIFEKKQECAKYKDSLHNEIKDRESNFEKLNYTESINEIFYSISDNSCYALTTAIRRYWDKIQTDQNIINLLTNELTSYNELSQVQREMYQKKVDQLKWS